MAAHHARIGDALDLLTQGLSPHVKRELCATFGDEWPNFLRSGFVSDRSSQAVRSEAVKWDAQALLNVMWDQWNAAFRQKLGLFERSLVSELREFRNRWAHQVAFESDDAYRVVDSAQRLLTAIHAPPNLLHSLKQIKLDILREELDRQADEDLQRSQANRERRIEVLLYVTSGLAIIGTAVVAVFPQNLAAGILLVAFTLLTFGYLVRQRTRQEPTFHGIHECRICGKIVYTEVCPYCAPPLPDLQAPTSGLTPAAASPLRLPHR